MKKKLFFAFLILSMLMCLLTISVSADEADMPSYDRTYNIDGVEYPIWEMDADGNYHPLIWYLNNENKMCKAWADNQDTTKAPYVTYACYISNGSDAEIGTIRIYDEKGTEYLTRERAVIVNLNDVKITYNGQTSFIQRINQNAFNKSSLIRAAFLPKSINMMGPNNNDQYKYSSFRECANLEYVEFPANSAIKTIGNAAFYRCSSLKAISLPNNLTVIEPVAFQHCTSLQAVYVPDGFQKMMCNNASSGSFNNCTSMYFVDEPFVLNSTLSNIPEKKSVYYFPSTFTGMGEGIRDCANMNETLVVPNYTSHTTSTYEGTGVKTVVYLGNMTYFWMTATQSTKLNIVFANTTSLPTVEVTGDHSAGTAIYLCKLNKCYDLNSKQWKDEATHFEEASKTVITPSTSCIEPSKKTTTCYCGTQIGTFEDESTVGGKHDLDIANGAKLVSITYEDIAKNGVKIIKCAKCGNEATEEATPILSGYKGYSIPNDSSRKGITFGYDIDTRALKEYKAVNTSLEIGFIIAVDAFLGGNAPLNENAEEASNVIKAKIDGEYSRAELVLMGDIWDHEVEISENEKLLASKVEFLMCAYSYSQSTGVQYIQGSVTALSDIERISYEQAYLNSAE